MATTECYQTLANWISQPFNRTGRAYLEAHVELLVDDIEGFVEYLLHVTDDSTDEYTKLRIHLQLLHDARIRGGTVQAVREAYINIFGGLIIDPPDYVLAVEQQLDTIALLGWIEHIVTTCKLQLYETIESTAQDNRVLPETTAELFYQLGNLFINASPRCLAPTLVRVISYYEQALNVYTLARYPLQHTKVLVALGNAYIHGHSEQQPIHLEKAMYYYELSLQNYSRHTVIDLGKIKGTEIAS